MPQAGDNRAHMLERAGDCVACHDLAVSELVDTLVLRQIVRRTVVPQRVVPCMPTKTIQNKKEGCTSRPRVAGAIYPEAESKATGTAIGATETQLDAKYAIRHPCPCVYD